MTVKMQPTTEPSPSVEDQDFINRVMRDLERIRIRPNDVNYTRGGQSLADSSMPPFETMNWSEYKRGDVKGGSETASEADVVSERFWHGENDAAELKKATVDINKENVPKLADLDASNKDELKGHDLFAALYSYPNQLAITGARMVKAEVAVPNSQFVSEIVGKQGERIKRLRKETKTCIQTPTKDEKPVFKITGRPAAVEEARRRIVATVEHLTKLRSQNVTLTVHVPDHLTGLVIGKKGSTINAIREATKTYVVSPKRPDTSFHITGRFDDVHQAREEIEKLIMERAGVIVDTDSGQIVGYVPNHGDYLLQLMKRMPSAAMAKATTKKG